MSRQIKQCAFRLRLVFIVPILFLASTTCSAQAENLLIKKPRADISDSLTVYYSEPEKRFTKNKQIPLAYEKQVAYALSWFPELLHIKIKFKIKKSTGGIISTRPTIGGLLRRSSKRKYIVTIFDSTAGRTLPTFANGGVNGQVGILGHELCHIVYFNNKSGLRLVGLAIAHVSRSYMDRFEYKTDSMDIVRGLGYQLMAWKQYLDKEFRAMGWRDASFPDKIISRERYMSVETIKRVMKKSGY